MESQSNGERLACEQRAAPADQNTVPLLSQVDTQPNRSTRTLGIL